MSSQDAAQRTFDSPQAAVDALIEAVRLRERPALRAIFGPDVGRLESGDLRQDDLDFQRFLAAYDLTHALRDDGDDVRTLVIGAHEWEFPAPIIRDHGQWRFDTNAGIEEIITRTVGRNELAVIDACGAYIAAQRQYYEMDPDGDGVKTYAQKLRSASGQRDGLHWPDAAGQPTSPLGPLVSQAIAEGEIRMDVESRQPYRGYYFRVLTAQGDGAPGGAMNYIDDDGRMTRGFALIAWPAAYDQTGVMTFIVGGDGVVHQKDLDENSDVAAAKIAAFDPAGWDPAANQ